MGEHGDSLTVDETHIYEGTAIFDTVHYRVFWVTEIGNFDVKVEPVTSYEVDEEIGWSLPGHNKCITNKTSFTRAEFKTLIAEGQLDPGPHPRTPTADPSERDQT